MTLEKYGKNNAAAPLRFDVLGMDNGENKVLGNEELASGEVIAWIKEILKKA